MYALIMLKTFLIFEYVLSIPKTFSDVKLNLKKNKKTAVFEFLNGKLSTKWDTPLIKVTEKGVNKKFKDYLEQNVRKDDEKK